MRIIRLISCFLFVWGSFFLAGLSVAHNSGLNVTVLAPGYSELDYSAPEVGTYTLPVIEIAADARLIDSENRQGSLFEIYSDKITILTFIYTGCDDANGCPLATFVMSQLAKRMEKDPIVGKQLQLVSFSFDLQRDTPEVLEKYAKPFRTKRIPWSFVVSTDRKSLIETLSHYDQSVQEMTGHQYAHLLRVFLIDKRRRIRNIYSTAFLHADTIINDVKTILAEEVSSKSSLETDRIKALPFYAIQKEKFSDTSLGLPRRNIEQKESPMANLGGELFFDRRLSINNTISCAMCHIPAQGFTSNELGTSVGFEGRTVRRNAPTLLNVGYLKKLFHDSRENSLEQQVWSPLLSANEMANPSIGFVVSKLKDLPGYRQKFEKIFAQGITMNTIGLALSAYERRLIAGGSDFDYYYYLGQKEALKSSARRGLSLFKGKAKCVLCHTIADDYALFSDEAEHNTGIGYAASMYPKESNRTINIGSDFILEFDLSAVSASTERKFNDLGRYEITLDPDDRWRYRTPSLRNVALTAPYMHDGSIQSLEEVIDFYEVGGVPNPLIDPLLQPLELSDGEKEDLVAFLRSLTSRFAETVIATSRTLPVGNP